MMLNTILFDLDGTLLPMDEETFVRAYTDQISRKYLPAGFQRDDFMASLQKGIVAMVNNDGSCTNEDRFWSAFSAGGEKLAALRDTMDSFYRGEFHNVRAITSPTPLSREIIDTLKEKGYQLVLATNPVFPPAGIRARLSWIDLRPEDFSHVTTYDKSSYCKPAAGYYREILSAIRKQPEECLMVGNNPSDDMSAAELGMKVYFVTDCIENRRNLPTDHFPQGSLPDVLSWARALPPLQ